MRTIFKRIEKVPLSINKDAKIAKGAWRRSTDGSTVFVIVNFLLFEAFYLSYVKIDHRTGTTCFCLLALSIEHKSMMSVGVTVDLNKDNKDVENNKIENKKKDEQNNKEEDDQFSMDI